MQQLIIATQTPQPETITLQSEEQLLVANEMRQLNLHSLSHLHLLPRKSIKLRAYMTQLSPSDFRH